MLNFIMVKWLFPTQTLIKRCFPNYETKVISHPLSLKGQYFYLFVKLLIKFVIIYKACAMIKIHSIFAKAK